MICSHLYFLAVSIAIASLLGCGEGNTATEQHLPQAEAAEIEFKEKPTSVKSDVDRIEDVHSIAALIERFREKKGHYPYEESFLDPDTGYVAVPAAVNITRQQLPDQYRYPPPGRSGAVYPYDEFLTYLRETLGDEITLPCDTEPIPRFYQYEFDGKQYYVSAVLLQPTQHTRQLAPGWHKYQVSSLSVPDKKILRYLDVK